MSRIPWYFYDPVEDEYYYWPVNPKEDSTSNAINKSFNYTSVAASRRTTGGEDVVSTVMFESRVDQQTFSYSGVVLEKAQFDAMEDWCSRPYPIVLVDDLQRGWLVYASVTWSRMRSRRYPYKHSYVFSGTIFEEYEV